MEEIPCHTTRNLYGTWRPAGSETRARTKTGRTTSTRRGSIGERACAKRQMVPPSLLTTTTTTTNCSRAFYITRKTFHAGRESSQLAEVTNSSLKNFLENTKTRGVSPPLPVGDCVYPMLRLAVCLSRVPACSQYVFLAVTYAHKGMHARVCAT